MTNKAIIKKWRLGKTAIQVAEDYMNEYNKEAKKRKERKITKDQALGFIEPVIFEFETKDWRK